MHLERRWNIFFAEMTGDRNQLRSDSELESPAILASSPAAHAR